MQPHHQQHHHQQLQQQQSFRCDSSRHCLNLNLWRLPHLPLRLHYHLPPELLLLLLQRKEQQCQAGKAQPCQASTLLLLLLQWKQQQCQAGKAWPSQASSLRQDPAAAHAASQ
jgi:hypothetical protein